MELELNSTKSPLLKLSTSGGNITVFGNILVYVLKPGNISYRVLAFILGAVSFMFTRVRLSLPLFQKVVYADAEFYLKTIESHELVCGNTTFLK